jgi:hypothetical protein
MGRIDKDDLKRRLPLPQLMAVLGHGDRAKRSAFCPFHENTRTEAFSVWQNKGRWFWHCFTGCGGGDEISYLQQLFNEPFKSALRRFADLAGGLPATPAQCTPRPRQKPFVGQQKAMQLPADLRDLTDTEVDAVAKLRGVSFQAVAAMRHLQTIKAGTVWDCAAWIVTDASNRLAQARRIDGQKFQFSNGKEKKAYTAKGGVTGCPLGARLPHKLNETFDRVLLVEGSGDFVAAHHFALKLPHRERRWLPIAMLGASARFIPEAIDALRGKLVRIVPHQDDNKAGQDAEKRWLQALIDAGLRGSTFSLQGLRQHDGRPVKDLNDCVNIHADDQGELGGLFQ